MSILKIQDKKIDVLKRKGRYFTMKDSGEFTPVVFCVNKSYLLQAFVVMHSILINSDAYYHFVVLSKDSIEENMNVLSKSLQKYYGNFSLFGKKINSNVFSDAKIFNPHIEEAAFYRLLIPELLTGYKKCIYLDCDVLVNGDLRELFMMDLENNYIAGVRDCHLVSSHVTKHQQNLGIPSLENYINSGVLIMDLEKMRKDRLVAKFLKQSEKDNLYEDQDVLNFCCYGHIKILPLKYNLFHFYKGSTIKELFGNPFFKKDFSFNWNYPFILHMGGFQKPWLDKKYKGAKAWWKLADIYRDSVLYKDCKKQCLQDDASKIRMIFNLCKNSPNVVLWGFSEQGKDVCDTFLRKEILVNFFCDNNKGFIGQTYRGIAVREVKEILKAAPDAIWIVTCKKAFKEVFSQLNSLGIKEEDFSFYI